MADKHLTEAAWKAFAKGKKLDDGDLLKALQALDKSEKKPAEEQLKAAQALDKASTGLRKQAKSDKDLAGYLDELDKTLVKKIKDLERLAKEEAEAAAAEEEDEESPALLTSKMAPLVKTLRKGNVTMPVLIATAGKETKVLIQRRSIAPTRKKMLAEALGVSGGIKYLVGECLLEDNQLTFVMQTQAAGLAKRIRAALLEQVEMRVKVRVRGEGGEVDEDLEDDGADGTQGAPAGQGEPQDPAPEAPPEAPPAPSAQALAYAERLRKVKTRLEQAEAAKHPEQIKLKALMQFAEGKGQAGDADAGMKGLDAVEKLLDAPVAAPAGGVDPATAFNARLSALMPRIKEAIVAGTPAGAQVKLKAAEAGALAKQARFDQGHAVLDDVERLLSGQAAAAAAPAAAAPPAGAGDERAQRFNALRGQLQQDYDALSSATLPPALAEQYKPIDTAWALAQEAADAGNHERALLILQRLADSNAMARLLQAAQAQATAGDDPEAERGRLVRQRTFMLQRWSRIPQELRAAVGGLRAAVAAAEADDDPDGLVEAIEAELDDLVDELQGMLDDAINAGSTALLSGVRARFERDDLIRHLRTGPAVDGGKLLAAVLGALDEIETEMTRA